MTWAEMDYDERLAAVATLARDGNPISMIAKVLRTTDRYVSEIMHEHGLSTNYHRPGHAVPASDDHGFGGGDLNRRRYEAWQRAAAGASATRRANENLS